MACKLIVNAAFQAPIRSFHLHLSYQRIHSSKQSPNRAVSREAAATAAAPDLAAAFGAGVAVPGGGTSAPSSLPPRRDVRWQQKPGSTSEPEVANMILNSRYLASSTIPLSRPHSELTNGSKPINDSKSINDPKPINDSKSNESKPTNGSKPNGSKPNGSKHNDSKPTNDSELTNDSKPTKTSGSSWSKDKTKFKNWTIGGLKALGWIFMTGLVARYAVGAGSVSVSNSPSEPLRVVRLEASSGGLDGLDRLGWVGLAAV